MVKVLFGISNTDPVFLFELGNHSRSNSFKGLNSPLNIIELIVEAASIRARKVSDHRLFSVPEDDSERNRPDHLLNIIQLRLVPRKF